MEDSHKALPPCLLHKPMIWLSDLILKASLLVRKDCLYDIPSRQRRRSLSLHCDGRHDLLQCSLDHNFTSDINRLRTLFLRRNTPIRIVSLCLYKKWESISCDLLKWNQLLYLTRSCHYRGRIAIAKNGLLTLTHCNSKAHRRSRRPANEAGTVCRLHPLFHPRNGLIYVNNNTNCRSVFQLWRFNCDNCSVHSGQQFNEKLRRYCAFQRENFS